MLSLVEDYKLANTYCKDDPVRPHIPCGWRIEDNRQMFLLYEDQYAEQAEPMINTPLAAICVAYCSDVPSNEQEMFKFAETDDPSVAVFYTVWSYHTGAGRMIINDTQRFIHERKSNKIKRYVTLSPLTRMAERFHIRNGAKLLEKHEDCQNFEYPLPK